MTLENDARSKTKAIEEKVDTGLKDLLDSYRSSYVPGGDQPNTLRERYVLHSDKPLPQYNTPLAEAFAASDLNQSNREGYALVLKPNLPYRTKAAEVLSASSNDNIQTVMGAGTVMLSHLDAARHVVFLETLNAPSLADIHRQTPRMHEHKVTDLILQPVYNAVQAMHSRDIVHGSINTKSVYFSENTCVLGECLSAPAGYYQDPLYEPLERMMANDNGRGHGDMKVDVYAIGVLAYEMIFGLEHLRDMPRDEFIRKALNIGTYQVFVQNRELSDSLSDFFRAVFCDSRAERWDLDQLSSWLAGKRYNIVVPPPPKEATRSLPFIEQDFYSRRALANAFHKNWRTTLKELRALRVDRWVEVSMHRTELADRIEKIIRSGGTASSDSANNDMLTRMISLLDPSAPIRTPFVSVRPEGIGLMLLESLQKGEQTDLQELRGIIENDIPNFWSFLLDDPKPPFLSKVLWRLTRTRQYLKMDAMGFGIERCIYDLNPSLTCQSELVAELHPMNLEELLKSLDVVAHKHSANTSFVDRHIASYCASKLDMGKELRINDLAAIPKLTKNKELISLRILARAQQRFDKLQLKGLATWAAMRVEIMIDQIHNRTIRKKLKLQLKGAASTGYLSEVLGVLVNREVVNKDFEGFGKAAILYNRNRTSIEQLVSPKYIDRSSRELGGRIATIIAYMILVGSAYLMISNLMRW